MHCDTSRLTILFDQPFWVGVYERESQGRYEVCKLVFGPEPKDYEVYQYLLDNWGRLRFSPATQGASRETERRNPKRMQREIQRQTQDTGMGTKAQQALKLQQEAGKLERQACRRQKREDEQVRQFAIRTEKRKEKHKGH